MSKLYRIFVKGLLALLPLMLTAYLLAWAVGRAEGALGESIQTLFPSLYFPGLGVAVTLILIFAVGLLVNNIVTAQIVSWFEGVLERAPVIKAIYGPIRDILSLFAEAEGKGKRAVLVEMPELGVSVIGLVMRESFDDLRGAGVPEGSIAVFIPYSYAVGGFTVLARRDHVRELNIAPERALQLAVTGWLKSDPRRPPSAPAPTP